MINTVAVAIAVAVVATPNRTSQSVFRANQHTVIVFVNQSGISVSVLFGISSHLNQTHVVGAVSIYLSLILTHTFSAFSSLFHTFSNFKNL